MPDDRPTGAEALGPLLTPDPLPPGDPSRGTITHADLEKLLMPEDRPTRAEAMALQIEYMAWRAENGRVDYSNPDWLKQAVTAWQIECRWEEQDRQAEFRSRHDRIITSAWTSFPVLLSSRLWLGHFTP